MYIENDLLIIEEKLQLLGRPYEIKEDVLRVKLAKGLISKITYTKESGVILQAELVPSPWNPISGLWRTDLQSSVIYNSILLFIALIVAGITIIDGFKIQPFIFLMAVLVTIHTVIWYAYYFIVFFSFKSQAENWIVAIRTAK